MSRSLVISVTTIHAKSTNDAKLIINLATTFNLTSINSLTLENVTG